MRFFILGEGQTDPYVCRGGDGQRDKADYGVWSPTVGSSTGAFQAPQPGEDAQRRTAPLLSRKK